jgi:hypothetical protein
MFVCLFLRCGSWVGVVFSPMAMAHGDEQISGSCRFLVHGICWSRLELVLFFVLRTYVGRDSIELVLFFVLLSFRYVRTFSLSQSAFVCVLGPASLQKKRPHSLLREVSYQSSCCFVFFFSLSLQARLHHHRSP